jgi:hypothetical protein
LVGLVVKVVFAVVTPTAADFGVCGVMMLPGVTGMSGS